MLNCYKIIGNRRGCFITVHNARAFMECGERNVLEMKNKGRGECLIVRSSGVSALRLFWKGERSVVKHTSVSYFIQLELMGTRLASSSEREQVDWPFWDTNLNGFLNSFWLEGVKRSIITTSLLLHFLLGHEEHGWQARLGTPLYELSSAHRSFWSLCVCPLKNLSESQVLCLVLLRPAGCHWTC